MAKATEHEGKVITCILPKGEAIALLKVLNDKGVTRINFAFARGFDVHDQDFKNNGLPAYEEKEVVTVIAKDAQEGEELFQLIFEAANINRLGGGIMYMSKLSGATPYVLPNLEVEQHQHSEARVSPKDSEASI